MRRARRVDSNQAAIVALLRALGCVVEVTSDVGRGFPDLVVKTKRGRVLLIEVKDGSKPPSARKLTADEHALSRRWVGHFAIVATDEDARWVAAL